MSRSELVSWVRKALADETIQEDDIDFGGNSGKTDGFSGDIYFISVTKNKKNLRLVIKSSRTNKATRNVMPIENLYKEEIYIYQTVLPAFISFQKSKRIENVFHSFPKFYKGILETDSEIIILENLKAVGYEMQDRKKPLNFSHLKIVLEEYGKLHAFSFATKDQVPEVFQNLTTNLIDIMHVQFNIGIFGEILEKEVINVLNILNETKEMETHQKLTELIQKGLLTEIRKFLVANTNCTIISHGDAWINNYMFLYENNDKSSPLKLSFIDWQISTARCSPVFDLSQFLYCCASPEDLNNLENLLTIYYGSLSKSLVQLGSNPEELFTFEDLKNHWEKFSLFGAFMAAFIMKQSLWEAKDAPDLDNVFEKLDNDDLMEVVSDIVVKDENYYKRIIAVYKNLFFYKWKK